MMKLLVPGLLVFLLVFHANSIYSETSTGLNPNKTTIEFRRIKSDQLEEVLNGNKIEGYKVMFTEKEPMGYTEMIPKLVAEDTEVSATKDDIRRIYSRQDYSKNWIIFIVFNKEISSKIVMMGENNFKREIAFIINGRLLGYPFVRETLKKYLNNKGQFEWPLPTHFTKQKEVEEFLSNYNLKLDYFSESSN